MIYDDGEVWEFSFLDKTPRLNKRLMQLPKSDNYFGYTDAVGALYFIHSDAEKGITKFHKSLNKNGHMIVPKSKRPLMRGGENFLYNYHHGVLLSNTFWTFGKYGRSKEIFHMWQNSGNNFIRKKFLISYFK